MSILDTLKSYMNADPAAPNANVQQDFQNVAQSAPPQHLATGLSQAFNSGQGGGFPAMLSNLFSQSNGQQRAGILSELLATAGPTLGGGLLQHFSGMGTGGTQVTPEQAQQVPPEAVQQLAQHAQQQDPSVVDRASSFYSQHPQVVQALGAGALALVMSHLSRQQQY